MLANNGATRKPVGLISFPVPKSCKPAPSAYIHAKRLAPSPRPRAHSPPHRATRPPATLVVFAPPRCLKHPPAAAAAVSFLTICRLPVSYHLILLSPSCVYSKSYSPSFLTASFLFSIASITRMFRILFTHVCELHPLIYTRAHSALFKLGPLVCALSRFPLAL